MTIARTPSATPRPSEGYAVVALMLLGVLGLKFWPASVELALLVVALFWTALRAGLGTSIAPLIFPAAMLLSGTHSADPATVAITAGVLVLTTLAALALPRLVAPDMFLLGASWLLRIVVLGSLALYLAIPSTGMETRWPNEGALIGMFVHKNLMGNVLVAAVLVTMYAPLRRGSRLVWLAVYGFAGYLCQSITAILVAGAVIASALLLQRIDWRSRRTNTTIIVAAPFLVATAAASVPLWTSGWADAFGRFSEDADRGRIWRGAGEALHDQPWTGWGFGTTFREGDHAAFVIQQFTGWTVPSAHSGYISTLLSGGAPALFALGIVALWALYRAWRARGSLTWPLVSAVVFITTNITDTRIDGLSWFMFCASAAFAAHVERSVHPSDPFDADTHARSLR